MKMGQIVVLCGLSDTQLTVPTQRPSPRSNQYLNLVSVLNDAEGITKHILNYIWAITSQKIMCKWVKWCISDLRSVSDWLNSRGYPFAKGYNSSASQWLSGEQVRLFLGHYKVHFGTLVEGTWGGMRGSWTTGGGGGREGWGQMGGGGGRAPSLLLTESKHFNVCIH